MKKHANTFFKYRFLLMELVKKGIRLKYRRSYLGILWTLLEPLLTTMVLVLVFGAFYGRDLTTFPAYVLTGRLVYSFFSQSTKGALRSIRSNSGMIKKVYVPKYVYPLSSVIFNFILFLISTIVLAGVVLFTGTHINPYCYEVVIPLFFMFLLSIGVGMILATGAVFFRDLEYLWDVVLMMIMYASAIFYKVDGMMDISDKGTTLYKVKYWMFHGNPVYGTIKLCRDAITGTGHISMEWLGMIMAWCGITLTLGIFMFYKKQDRFILHI